MPAAATLPACWLADVANWLADAFRAPNQYRGPFRSIRQLVEARRGIAATTGFIDSDYLAATCIASNRQLPYCPFRPLGLRGGEVKNS